ncbi:TPA: phage tail protein [Escherichia coli]
MIYTTGTIAINGNTVKGTGTNFSEPLSLIRVGCTLIAIGNPVQIFTITEIKSGTELSVTPAANPAISAGTKFSILLSDSISVDGLAQDVAETLRYYQGKESEIADAVEFFSDNKDVVSASKLASTSAATATNAAKTATTAADSAKTYRDEAHQYANQTAQPYAYVLQPLPDVWIPFNDSLDMITGYSPGAKKVTIDGEEKRISSDKVVSFSRATNATYINKSGVLTKADVNIPRFERNGLLIEGQRTNYLKNSDAPELWTIHGLLTKEFGTDKYGFNYATVTVPESGVGTSSSYFIHSVASENRFSLSAGETYTFSARFRGVNSRCRAHMSLTTGENTKTSIDTCLTPDTGDVKVYGDNPTVTFRTEKQGDWCYFEVTYTASGDINEVEFGFYITNPENGNFSSDSSLTMTTPQVEKGSCASSFIITGDVPATRASDIVDIPVTNNIVPGPLSCLVEVHRNWVIPPSSSPRIIATTNVDSSNEQMLLTFIAPQSSDVEPLPYCQFGVRQSFIPVDTKTGGFMVAGFVLKADSEFKCVTNGKFGSIATTTWQNPGAANALRIGGTPPSGNRNLFGHVRNLRIWHKALTDAQLSESI